MKRCLYIIFTIALLSSALTNAQTPCDQKTDYGRWIILKEWDCLPTACRTAIAFKPGVCNGNSICGYGLRWKFLNEHQEKEASIKFKFNYKTCGGEVKTTEESISLDKTGITEGAGNFTSGLGYEVIGGPYDIVYTPSRNSQTTATAKEDFNKGIRTFDINYNEVNNGLSRLTNVQQRAEAQNKLTSYHNSFNSLKTSAQQNINQQNGIALAQNVEQLNQINKDILNLLNDYKEGTPNPIARQPVNTQNSNVGSSGRTTGTTTNRSQSYSGNTQQASTTKTSTTTNYVQQLQQWQNNNQKTQQTINNAFDGLKNQIQQAYEERTAAREEQYEREKKQREEKEQQEQQEREEKRQQEERELQEERKRQDEFRNALEKEYQLVKEIGGESFYTKPSKADLNNPTATVIYYVAFFREENTVWLMKPLKINKYTDDSWLTEEKLKTMIAPGFPVTYKKISDDNYQEMLQIRGYYINEQDAVNQYNMMLQNGQKIGCTVNIIQPAVSNKSTQSSTDFWKN